MFHETFGHPFKTIKFSLNQLSGFQMEKAYLKKKLSVYSDISVENLTYNNIVIDY